MVTTTMDAKSRALRTAAQGLALDIATALTAVLATSLTGVTWTRAWWAALGLLLLKTAAQTGVSYLHRVLVPPPRQA